MGAATLFGKIMTYEEAPLRLARAVLEFSTNKYVVLLLIIAALRSLRHESHPLQDLASSDWTKPVSAMLATAT